MGAELSSRIRISQTSANRVRQPEFGPERSCRFFPLCSENQLPDQISRTPLADSHSSDTLRNLKINHHASLLFVEQKL